MGVTYRATHLLPTPSPPSSLLPQKSANAFRYNLHCGSIPTRLSLRTFPLSPCLKKKITRSPPPPKKKKKVVEDPVGPTYYHTPDRVWSWSPVQNDGGLRTLAANVALHCRPLMATVSSAAAIPSPPQEGALIAIERQDWKQAANPGCEETS